MKTKLFLAGIGVLVFAGVYVFGSSLDTASIDADQRLVFAGEEISIEIANTTISRAQGLSGRESLPVGSGLLFTFNSASTYGFWMKDMNFPIDILWFDSEKKLVDITRDISPDTFPETFYPDTPAMYVLETNVGEFDVEEGDFGEGFELK